MDEDYGGFVEATPDGRSDPQRVLAGRKQQRPLHTPIDSNRKWILGMRTFGMGGEFMFGTCWINIRAEFFLS